MKNLLTITLGLILVLTSGCGIKESLLGGHSSSDKVREINAGDHASQINAEAAADVQAESGDDVAEAVVATQSDSQETVASTQSSSASVSTVQSTNISLTASTITSSHIQEEDRFNKIGQPCLRSELLNIHVNFFLRNGFQIASVLGCLPLNHTYVSFDDLTPDKMKSLDSPQWVPLIEGNPSDSILLHMTKDAETEAWEFLVVHGYGNASYQYVIGSYSSLIRRNEYDPTAMYAKPNQLAQGKGFMKWAGAAELSSGPITQDLSFIQTSTNMGELSATISSASLPKVTIKSGNGDRILNLLPMPRF